MNNDDDPQLQLFARSMPKSDYAGASLARSNDPARSSPIESTPPNVRRRFIVAAQSATASATLVAVRSVDSSSSCATTTMARVPSRKRLLVINAGYTHTSPNHDRPTNSTECPTARPCPWVSCRYHLLIDTTSKGSLILNGETSLTLRRGASQSRATEFEQLAIEQLHAMTDTCAWDVIERGDEDNETVARRLGYTREGVRLLLDVIGTKIKASRALVDFAP